MSIYKRDKLGRLIPKHKRNKIPGVWYYDIQIAGVRIRKHIPEAVTAEQAKVAEADARSDLFKNKYGEKGQANFEKFVREIYLPWSRENKRSAWQDEYLCEIVCDFFRGKTFAEITPALVEKFKQERRAGVTTRGTKRSKNTVNRELAQLSKIFNYAVDLRCPDQYGETNPCARRRFKTDDDGHCERFITRDEEAKILEALTGRYARLRPVFLLALYAGMRRGEIFALEWPDIDFDQDIIRVRRSTTKNGKGRLLPMGAYVKSELIALRKATDGSKPEEGDEKKKSSKLVFPFNKQVAGDEFSDVCRGLNLEGEKVTLHTCRHTFCTRLAGQNVNPFVARDLMGHIRMDMTNYYSHTLPDSMRDAVKMLENGHGRPDNATEEEIFSAESG